LFKKILHGGSGVAYGLIEALRAATGKKYLELIHRIDRDTSGLVMISKKRSTLKLLQDMLQTHFATLKASNNWVMSSGKGASIIG